MKKIIVALSLIVIGCASVHEKNIGQWVDDSGQIIKEAENKTLDGLVISGDIYHTMSSDYFRVVTLTFENQSDEWRDIEVLQMGLGSDEFNKSVKAVAPQKIAAWGEAEKNILNVEQYNQAMLFTGISLVGLAAMTSGDKSVQTLGAASYLAGSGVLVAKGIKQGVDEAENKNILINSNYPENHLLRGTFQVPPGLFLRRWIVLQSKDPTVLQQLNRFLLKYKVGNEKRTIRIVLSHD